MRYASEAAVHPTKIDPTKLQISKTTTLDVRVDVSFYVTGSASLAFDS